MSTSNNSLTGIEAAVRFQYLTQTGSVVDYASEFLKLHNGINRETYLASLYFAGLKDELQNGIRRLGKLPDTWEEMAKRAIAVEHQIHEERRRDGLRFTSGKPNHVAR